MPSCSRRTWYIIAGVSVLAVCIIVTAVVLAVVLTKSKSEIKDKVQKWALFKRGNGSSNISDYLLWPFRKIEKVVLQHFMSPLPIKLSDVEYDFYTQKNKNHSILITNNDISVLSHSYFDPQKRIVFVCHGWRNNRTSLIHKTLIPAIIEHHDVNLFVVNWEKRAKEPYEFAQRYVKSVGEIVGAFINKIQFTYNLTGGSFILIGHSLGAQVVGSAGGEVKSKVKHIVGLDPAAPFFMHMRTDNRLDRSDALFVQIIHTNGGRLGFYGSMGHVDYFPNGGMQQPGCSLLDLKGSCSHARAFLLYAESLIRGPVFRAYRCDNWRFYTKASCNRSIVSFMGQLEHNTNITGDFYLETNGEPPYAKN